MSLNFQNRGSAPLSRALLIVLLIVSVVMMTMYAREGASGPLHTVQSAVSGVFAPLKATRRSSRVGSRGCRGRRRGRYRIRRDPLGFARAQRRAHRAGHERGGVPPRGGAARGSSQSQERLRFRRRGRARHRTQHRRVEPDRHHRRGCRRRRRGGLTVMGPAGVVGQVVSASPGSAVVRLLTDPQSGAAAMVQSSRAEGVVRGSLNGLMYLENVGDDVSVNVGDVVLTSGLGGSYTKACSSARSCALTAAPPTRRARSSCRRTRPPRRSRRSSSSQARRPTARRGLREVHRSGRCGRVATVVGAIAAVALQVLVAPNISLGFAVPNFLLAYTVVIAVILRAEGSGR